ncbi:rhodopirellula transposase [Clostridium tepidiprofundi DSM 19306]|uniref:Rhodopirellula transposase n=1 Tax=Clostridium tepidiprofundi DSM 19306 TaxID=1121338 RepID=A0A151AS29_9CLOT|nr:hypothetical protein [Clostridium tepidiprofundi]KYH30454.1 rhodopirellula transposase [Clostridium tepidiprofundi DSM 19306]
MYLNFLIYRPLKKIPETDAIFDNLKEVHNEKNHDNILRISIDTKDRVKIGQFSRGGKSRVLVTAADHDFGDEYLTPFGILDVTNDKVDLSFTKSKVTADFMVDAIKAYLIRNNYHVTKDTITINADNGPENNSRRTQFIKRIIYPSAKYDLKIILAYYPPYHSKYNPIERVWGILEQHWNGAILDETSTVLAYAKTMKWKAAEPYVNFIKKKYMIDKKVSKKVMKIYETMIERAELIGKWFVTLTPSKCKKAVLLENKP